MRGLKPHQFNTRREETEVASFTDAWIETGKSPCLVAEPKSRIFYRCVDWNPEPVTRSTTGRGRIFYRCVDWNGKIALLSSGTKKSHLLQMRGLKQRTSPFYTQSTSRIFYRFVDWNILSSTDIGRTNVASFTDAWIETSSYIVHSVMTLSHLLQMRGLKLIAK